MRALTDNRFPEANNDLCRDLSRVEKTVRSVNVVLVSVVSHVVGRERHIRGRFTEPIGTTDNSEHLIQTCSN